MEKEFLSPLLAVAAMAGAILGVILGWALRRPGIAGQASEAERYRRHYQDASRELAATQKELSRKNEIASMIPMIVRRLSGRLSADAIPSIAVRLAKEYFRASQAGFFAPVAGETEVYTLVEGVGFPFEWKGKVRLAADEGILGRALESMLVTTRKDYITARGRRQPGIRSLEKNGVTPDLVAPVTMNSKALGALVVVTDIDSLAAETPFASMIAELVSSAFLHATTIESVEHSASVDPLTGVYTRGYFASRFEAEVRRARNYGHSLSLILLDIDRFKNVNDTYGHQAGDLILIRLGQLLRDSVRASDVAARYGGEEFAVLLTTSGKEEAMSFSENLRRKVESTWIPVPGTETPLQVTVSIGVAVYPADGNSTTDLIRSADGALYEAKQAGRNRTVGAREIGLDGVPLR